MMTIETPEQRLREFLGGVDADVVVCGHTHMPFDRLGGHVRVINPGSVGMPYGIPGTFWALLGPEIEFRRTDSDLWAAAARIRKGSWPVEERFARETVWCV